MKKTNSIFCGLLCAVWMAVFLILPVSAAGGNGSLTLEYAQEGVTFQMYQVGQRMEDGSLELTGDFTDYSVDLSQDDWLDTAATLAALAARDQLPADASGVVSDGTVTFSKLENGIYLVVGASNSQGGFYYTPVPFLVELSGQAITAQVKFDQEEEEQPLAYTVKKVWSQDQGQDRPDQVTVQLLRDGEVYRSALLNDSNHWSYTWDGLESGHRWQVTEQDVPEGYQMSVSQEGTVFRVTNTWSPEETPTPPTPDETPSDTLPQTGQLWWPVPLLLGAGLLLLLWGGYRHWKQGGSHEH